MISNSRKIDEYRDSGRLIYSQLESLINDRNMSVKEKYFFLRGMFRRVVDFGTADKNINFVGLFAKLDFIIKENNIPRNTASILHFTRNVLNGFSKKNDEELEKNFLHDVKSVAILTGYVYKDCSLPSSLKSLLPVTDIKPKWKSYETAKLRCTVMHWDDEFIYVTEETNGDEMKVCYGKENKYLTREGKGDWNYLGKILCENAQLSLVRIRMKDDVCYPELIIFQPDCLISITTISSCFETYAFSPLVALINKLKPQQNTSHIHLGNIAGEFLDDTVHGKKISFDDRFRQYFHQHAMSILTCPEMTSQSGFEAFRNSAERQQEIIEKLIGEDLRKEVKEYENGDVLLEPTFFSEVLGIQGRMDFLFEKNDDVIIIEQKSGKARFVPGANNHDNDIPLIKETHWIQLLLYRALYIYEFQKYAEQLRHVMLLYSDYRHGLVSPAQSQELFLQAIKMRNLIAAYEINYAQNGFEILDELTPDRLNKNQLTGKLWTMYVRPELEQILSPIHNASTLEKKYFYRFMRFIAREHMLAKLGNQTKDDSGFASVWHDTAEDKKAAGNIYDGLTVSEFGRDENGCISSVKLLFSEAQSNDTSNFRQGDIVIMYHYKKGETPFACAGMVIRGTISNIRTDCLEIALHNSQTEETVFPSDGNTLWAVEHDMYESSSSSLLSGMHSLLSAPKERRDLLLSQRKPLVDDTLYIKGEYGPFNELVSRAKKAREIFLVIGPPGTGKTSFGLMSILREELLEPGTNILLLSYTNRAVDEICSKLENSEEKIDYIRIGSELSCEKAYRDNVISNKIKKCKNGKAVQDLLKTTRVFCGTVAAVSTRQELFMLKHFDLAVIDEASQILEPHLAGLFAARHKNGNAVSRFVFIGDHKQLPAVVQQTAEESEVTDEELLEIGLTNCRNSLFERLLAQFRTEEGYDPQYVYMLRRHARMHEDIAEFPNHAFYGDQLRSVPLQHQQLPTVCADSKNGIVNMLTSHRLTFVASERPAHSLSAKTNIAEAEMIAATVRQIYEMTKDSFDAARTIGVIVPYRNQISTIRSAIDRYGISVLHDITIDTVERYQGSQRDYIIYGFTVQYTYQLAFLTNNIFLEDGVMIDRKLNVAMTRAQLGIVLFGNPDILRLAPVFRDMIDFIKEKGAYYEIPKTKYLEGCF